MYSYLFLNSSAYHHPSCEECKEGRRSIDVNHTSQLEAFIYLSGSGTGTGSGSTFPDFPLASSTTITSCPGFSRRGFTRWRRCKLSRFLFSMEPRRFAICLALGISFSLASVAVYLLTSETYWRRKVTYIFFTVCMSVAAKTKSFESQCVHFICCCQTN